MEIKLISNIGILNHPNHNGRIYDSEMMKKAVEDFNKNGIKTCELNPDYLEKSEFLSNEPFFSHNSDKIAGEVKEVKIEDNKLVGKVHLLDNENGKTVKALIDSGKLRLGPRMLAESISVLDEEGNQKLDENGNPIVEIGDVEIVSMDIISDK